MIQGILTRLFTPLGRDRCRRLRFGTANSGFENCWTGTEPRGCFAITVPVPKPPVSVSVPNRRFSDSLLRFQTAIFCGSGFILRFFGGFSRFWFGTGGSGTVSVQKYLNLNRTMVQESTVSVRVNSHGYGFGFNRRFSNSWAGRVYFIFRLSYKNSLYSFMTTFFSFFLL